jgi:hypothetical protein
MLVNKMDLIVPSSVSVQLLKDVAIKHATVLVMHVLQMTIYLLQRKLVFAEVTKSAAIRLATTLPNTSVVQMESWDRLENQILVYQNCKN